MSSPAQKTYDDLASVYDERWADYTQATLGATIAGLALRPGDRILDLATGTGELARRLLASRDDLQIVGVDLSEAMLSRGRNKRELWHWHPVQAEAARLPFAADSFDAAVSANAFHLFDAPELVLREIRRVLRPGGLFTLTDWCDDYLTCKLCGFWLELTDPSFRRSYTLQTCRRLLEAAGFRVLAQERFKINWLWGLMRVIAVDDLDLDLDLGSDRPERPRP
jgi:ubiquinone/menaquinone biosynthesis C-methylase UbiE